ncbi:MAG: ribonuclease P protein component [Deferribacteraceae bacterium]|nr:ribonuclease P protein component [Deferribacteraceae bacterium]
MINSDIRLRGKENFALFARASHYRGSLLRIACVRREGLKVAFVVGKKVSQKAVERNKIKRRLRELFKKHRHLLPQDFWLMLIAMPEARTADFASLEADIDALFKQVAAKKAANNASHRHR